MRYLGFASVFLALLPAMVLAEGLAPVALVTGHVSDPCAFERTEAYGAGIQHYSTEMLWGCEAVAKRRSAAMPLGERLSRFEAALGRYEAAVAEASQRGQKDRQRNGWYMPVPTLSKDEKQAIAEQTGALQALAEIRTGF